MPAYKRTRSISQKITRKRTEKAQSLTPRALFWREVAVVMQRQEEQAVVLQQEEFLKLEWLTAVPMMKDKRIVTRAFTVAFSCLSMF